MVTRTKANIKVYNFRVARAVTLTKSNMKLISILSESDRIVIQLHIRGGARARAPPPSSPLGGAGALRARSPTNGYIDAAGLRGRYSFRKGCFPVNVLRGIRKGFGRHSEGIRTKKRNSGKSMFQDFRYRVGGASKVLSRMRVRVCPL